MKDFSITEINFIRCHYGIDMTVKELAHYFQTGEKAIHVVAHNLKLPYPQESALHSFCTPYPFRIAVGVTKFSWPAGKRTNAKTKVLTTSS